MHPWDVMSSEPFISLLLVLLSVLVFAPALTVLLADSLTLFADLSLPLFALTVLLAGSLPLFALTWGWFKLADSVRRPGAGSQSWRCTGGWFPVLALNWASEAGARRLELGLGWRNLYFWRV